MLPAEIDVQGKVVDAQGNPLSGITVSIKGTNRVTATDKDGLFSIKAVNAQDAKCEAEQREEDENDPRTGKIIAALHTNDTRLLLTI